MKVVKTYSHLNGYEFMKVHKRKLIKEIEDTIAAVDAEACRTKKSEEKRKRGKLLYSPKAMNAAFKKEFERRGWQAQKFPIFVTDDERLARQIYDKTAPEQKSEIEAAGKTPLPTSNQTDFVKQRVAVEVQLGKYAFVAHDLFVKHMSFFVGDKIDVGIEILPMKSLEQEMSSGVAYFERDMFNLVRQGRGIPAVPLIIYGIAP